MSSALLLLAACDDFRYPQDPDGTLDRVLATDRMRVVAIDHVPWVIVDGDAPPEGVEPELVKAFARELGVEVEWRRAPAFEAFEALEKGDVDLVIGGFPETAVTAHGTAAPTYAYFTDALIVASEPGTPVPEELDGERVHVPADLTAAGLVEEKDGIPVSRMSEEIDLVALHQWQLSTRDLVPTGIVLKREKRVMAIPKGENAWLMRLERFLRDNAGRVGALLREHAS